jgi:transketolase
MTPEQALRELVLADERYNVKPAENRAAIRSLPEQLGARFDDVGIAEQALIGIAAGLALRGRVPIAHALAAFLTMRAFEFVRTDIGIGQLPVKLVGAVPGFLSDANGPTHQALEDVALMRGIPGMQVFCPADEQDLVLGLHHLLASPRPAYIRYNNLPPVTQHSAQFAIGRAEVFGDQADVAILVYGALFRQAWKAKQQLQAQGIAVRLLNMRTMQPVDEEAVLAAATEARLLVTLEDHFLTGGLYSTVCEILVRYQIPAYVLPMALPGRWFKPALLAEVLAHEGFTADQIAEAIARRLPSASQSGGKRGSAKRSARPAPS